MDLRLLGRLDAELPQNDAASRGPRLGPPKQRALLALLAAECGRAVSIARITDSLWGEAPPASALASIHAYVSNLRRLLHSEGHVAVRRVGSSYLLDFPDSAVDALRFRAAFSRARLAAERGRWAEVLEETEQALAEWRDRALVDLLDFDELRDLGERLDRERVECRALRVRAMIELDSAALALPEAAELHRDEMLSEEHARLHMLALLRLGRTAEASTVFHAHAEALAEQTGLDPSPGLVELHTEVLRAADVGLVANGTAPFAADAVPASAGVAEPPNAAPHGLTGAATPGAERAGDPEATSDQAADELSLVGRIPERTRLRQAMNAVLDGRAQWALLSGPPGIGKTVLTEWAARRFAALTAPAAASEAVIRLRAREVRGGSSTDVVRQLLERLGADPEPLLDLAEADADLAQYSLTERIEQLLRERITGPTLLIIDDLHWCDPATLRSLLLLLDAIEGIPLLVLLTTRDGVEGSVAEPGLRALTAAMTRRSDAAVMTISAFDAAEVGELLRSVTGEPATESEIEALLAASSGSPFLVNEFAQLPAHQRDAEHQGSGIAFVLDLRLTFLEPEVLAVLRIAAVIGEDIDAPMLAGLCGTDLDALADVLDEATDLGFVVSRSDGYAFSHALIREHILATIAAPRRHRLELGAAEWLRRGSPNAHTLARRANHLLAARPLLSGSEAIAACTEAAQAAEAESDSAAAAHWWGQALAVHLTEQVPGEERDRIRLAYIEALARAGQGSTAIQEIGDGLLAAVRESRPDSAGRVAAALLRLSGCWPWPIYEAETFSLFGQLQGIEPFVRSDPAAHARVLAALAVGSYYAPDAGIPEQLSTQALAIAEQLGDADVLADAILGRLLAFVGGITHAEEALELVDRLLALSHAKARFDTAIGAAIRFGALFTLGRVSEARRAHGEAMFEADAHRIVVLRVQMRWAEAQLSEWEGDYEKAEEQYDLAFRMHHATELYLPEAAQAAALFTLKAMRGSWQELAPYAELDNDLGTWGKAVKAVLDGDREAGAASVDGFLERALPMRWPTLATVTLAAHVAAELRITERAHRLIEFLDPFRHAIATAGQVGTFGSVAFALARLYRLVGDEAEAEACERIEEALRAQ